MGVLIAHEYEDGGIGYPDSGYADTIAEGNEEWDKEDAEYGLWGDMGEWVVLAGVVVAVVECGAVIVSIALHIYTI